MFFILLRQETVMNNVVSIAGQQEQQETIERLIRKADSQTDTPTPPVMYYEGETLRSIGVMPEDLRHHYNLVGELEVRSVDGIGAERHQIADGVRLRLHERLTEAGLRIDLYGFHFYVDPDWAIVVDAVNLQCLEVQDILR